jgi:hypothetical protein
MKKIFLLLATPVICLTAGAQFVARMEVKEPISGLCNDKEVYVMFPSFKGQAEAVCPVSKDSILKRLNTEISFLKDSSSYNDKAIIGLVINCKGQVIQCKMDNKTKYPELDRQIEVVFNSLGQWKAGKLNGKAVDTSNLTSFKISNGVFIFN